MKLKTRHTFFLFITAFICWSENVPPMETNTDRSLSSFLWLIW